MMASKTGVTMTDRKVAIRIGTDGKSEVQQDFKDVQATGEGAMDGIAQAADKAGTAAERAAQRQIDAWKRQAAAAKVASVSSNSQDAINSALAQPGNSGQFATVNLDRSTGAARDSAAAFQAMFAAEDEAAKGATQLAAALVHARAAMAAEASQSSVDNALSQRGSGSQFATVNLDRTVGGAKESAAAFQAMFAAEDEAAAAAIKLQAAINPLYTAQARYDAELKTWALALKSGKISEADHATAVAQTTKALEDAKKGLDEHSNSLGLNRVQFQVGASAAHRFVDSILAGQSPMRAFMMQAGDVATVLQMDDGGVAGGLEKVRSLLNPTTIGIAAITAVLVAATAAWVSYTNALDREAALAQGAGAVIGATGAALEANAVSAANAGNISVSSARDIEAAYVKLGGVGLNVLSGLTAVTTDFAKATGQDAAGAEQELGKAFQDPVKGAQDLTTRYGTLTQAQIAHIQELVQANDLYGAQAVLLHALQAQFDGAADHANILARAWHGIESAASDAWTSMGKAIDIALGGGSALDQLNKAYSDRQKYLNSTGGFGDTSYYDKKIADLQAQLQKEKDSQNTAQAKSRAVTAMGYVDAATGGNQQDDLQSKLTAITAMLADNGKAAGLTAKQLADARTAQDEYTHAVSTYLPEGEKQAQLAKLAAQDAAARDPAEKARIAAAKQRIEDAGKVITAAQAEADAEGKGAAAKAQAAKSGEGHAATLAREAAAMDANVKATLAVAAAYLQSDSAGAAAAARRTALTDATKKGIDVDAQVQRQLALDAANAIATAAQQVSGLRIETAARTAVDMQVSKGALAVGLMNQALSDEAALRPLLKVQAQAQGEALTQLTAVVTAYRKALADAHAEEAHSQALQSVDALRNRVADAQLAARYAGDTTGAADRAKAVVAANREADSRGYDDSDRAAVVSGNLSATNAEMDARRAASAAQALKASQDQLEVSNAEIGLIGKSADEHDQVIARLKLQQQLATMLGDEYGKYAPAILAASAAAEQNNERLKRLQDDWAEIRNLGDQALDTLEHPDGSALKSLLREVESEMIKLAAINPLKNLLLGENNPTLSSVMKFLSGGSTDSLLSSRSTAESAILAAPKISVPGFAAGTDYAPGGLALVGEHGPEIANLPAGTSVTNATDTQRLLSSGNDNGPREVHNHFTGNLLTPEFWQRINAGDDNAALRGTAGGAQVASQRSADAAKRKLGTRG